MKPFIKGGTMLRMILKKLRSNANLTQKQAAELIGIARRSWERYEAGSANINMRNVELFAIKTGQNLDNVIREEGKSNPDLNDFLTKRYTRTPRRKGVH